MGRPALVVVAALLALGCGSTIVITPSAGDAGAVGDAGALDAAAAADAPVAPEDSDAVAVVDAVAAVDGGGRDVAVAADGGSESLQGRWRVTGLQATGTDGVVRTLTDVNSPFVGAAGATNQVRANGVLLVAGDHLAAAIGTLVNDHFYIDATGYSAGGFGAAGLLDDASGRFSFAGSTSGLTLLRNPDGTITITGDSFGAMRVTFARAGTVPAVPLLSAIGLGMTDTLVTNPPPNLRVALFWDHVGSPAYNETNGVAITLSGRYASYPMTLSAPPPAEAQGRVGVATVALARIAIYSDLDGSRTFVAGVDRVVAISPVAIAWRDAAAASDATNSPVRDLSPGYQYVFVHPDGSVGATSVTPYDNTHLASPDIPVFVSGMSGMTVADIL